MWFPVIHFHPFIPFLYSSSALLTLCKYPKPMSRYSGNRDTNGSL